MNWLIESITNSLLKAIVAYPNSSWSVMISSFLLGPHWTSFSFLSFVLDYSSGIRILSCCPVFSEIHLIVFECL